jgi:hypothetical protein
MRGAAITSCVLIGFALIPGCAPGVGFEPVTSASQRYAIPGASVLPPSGGGWFASRQGNSAIMFYKAGDRPTSTAYALLWMRDASERQFATPQEFLDAVRAQEERMGPGERLLSSRYVLDGQRGPWCIQFDQTQEDRRVPGHAGEVFVATTSGYHHRHPAAPGIIVTAVYSERVRQGDPPPHVASEVRPFFDSLKFTEEAPRP